MRDDREIAEEALRRANAARQGRGKMAKRVIPILSAAGFVLMLCLTALPNTGAGESPVLYGIPAYGGVVQLAGESMGGYVVIGIAAFVAGMLVTLFCMKAKGRR